LSVETSQQVLAKHNLELAKAELDSKNLICKFRDHVDLRMEVNDHLIGITLHPPVPEGKTSWDVVKERIKNNQRIQCSVKYPHPKDWLTEEGKIIFPTLHRTKGKGRARHLAVGMMEIKETFTVRYGVQRRNLHEYFFKSNKKGGVMNGRFVLRVINLRGEPRWIFIKPKDQLPLNPVLHKDEGYYKIIRDEDLTLEMARSPVRD